ncbi:hypothetical protein Tco_1379081 [Tanacetum coccineum]
MEESDCNCLSTQLLYECGKITLFLELEADMSTVHDELKLISKLERECLNLKLNYQSNNNNQELFKCVIDTCPKSFNERDNKAPSTPVTRKKQVTFSDKPGTSSINDSTEASGSKPRSNTKKNRILPAKKENKKEVEVRLRTNNFPKNPAVWKLQENYLQILVIKETHRKGTSALGKNDCVFSMERPTGKKFTLGEICQSYSRCFCDHGLSWLKKTPKVTGKSVQEAHEFCGKLIGSSDSGMIT